MSRQSFLKCFRLLLSTGLVPLHEKTPDNAMPALFFGHGSPMNIVWRLPSEDLEKTFIEQAQQEGLSGLKGHRSVGGCRASIYNAMPVEGVQALADFMQHFMQKNG